MNLEIDDYALTLEYPEPENKLAVLLLEDVIFCNNGHWRENWPKDQITLHVNCSDVFAWACADSEDITYSEITELYEMWKKDNTWGSAAWCIKKRKERPQKPVEDRMTKAGIWNIEDLLK